MYHIIIFIILEKSTSDLPHCHFLKIHKEKKQESESDFDYRIRYGLHRSFSDQEQTT